MHREARRGIGCAFDGPGPGGVGLRAPVAERIWTDENDERASERHRNDLGQATSDLKKFERDGRVVRSAFDEERDLRSVAERDEEMDRKLHEITESEKVLV